MSDPSALNAQSAHYTFLPHVRTGLAASISTPDDLGEGTATDTGRVSVSVEVRVNETPHAHLTKQVQLVGPADVNGIQERAIVRTSPLAGTQNFEPNYFPFVEFFEEDFLWRYTPAAANGDKLRPWLYLLVLKREEFTLLPYAGATLPAIRITPEGLPFAFPPVAEHWAWGHVQANFDLDPGNSGQVPAAMDRLANAVGENPGVAICRLLSSRRLVANTHYSAFLVPAFEAGRLAGLGLPTAEIPMQQSAFGATDFPYYHAFEFATGERGDFESLVEALRPHVIDPAVGKRPLDVRNAGQGLTVGDGAGISSLDGALLPVSQAPTAPLAFDGADDFAEGLIPLLNAPAEQKSARYVPGNSGLPAADAPFLNEIFGAGNPAHTEADPVVAPPLYGQWYTDRDQLTDPLPTDLTGLDWWHQLNLEPGLRAAAGLGAEVVRRNQQAYMQACWDQVGELLEANRKIRQMQLAREATEALLDKHVRVQSAEAVLAMTERAHDRIRLGEVSVRQSIRESALPNAAPTANLRRILRTAGPTMKRLTQAVTQPLQLSQRHLLQRLSNPADLRVAPVWTVSTQQNRVSIADLHQLTETVTTPTFAPTSAINLQLSPVFQLLASTSFFSIYQASLSPYRGYFAPNLWPGTPNSPAFDPAVASDAILTAMAPLPLLQNRLSALLDVGNEYTPTAGLSLPSLITCPKLDLPTYAPLVDYSSDFLLPNLEKIPENSVAVMKVNQQFLEAYLAGMNDEMLRELLWREFPTHQQGTIFRYFWDHSDHIDDSLSAQDLEVQQRDIEDIEAWTPGSQIGTHATRTESGLVLVIRGELLRRYPNTVVYAGHTNLTTGEISEERYPVFSAKIDPDIALLGFDVPLSEAMAPNSPWFFIFQERPGEPRFGLEVEAVIPGQAPAAFHDLSWENVGLTNGHLALTHPDHQTAIPHPQVAWGNNAADMAHIFYQDPVRVAFHAPDLISDPLSNS